jgi:pyridoxal phosphate enzyme (YggS family)
MSIADNLNAIRATLPSHVKLVCVSKFHPNDSILEAYEAGEKIFGESKVQEVCQKQETLPQDIVWHFIGHLQTNKVKFLVPFVSLIHSVDSLRLLEEINKQAVKAGRTVDCLLQVHIAREETKFGFSPEEVTEALSSDILQKMNSVRIRGLMGMATFTDNETQVHAEFRSLKTLFDQLRTSHTNDLPLFDTLSMGMSDDYRIAIEEGSTMVRVGSSIFGARQY